MKKHAFENSLLRGIPAPVAADFFYKIKHAGWGDPPDETGQLEGQFAVPIEQVVNQLAEIAAAKFKLMVAYHVFAESMRGVASHACSEMFHEHASQERAAAEAYLKRASVLGNGPVHLPEIEPPPASSDPVGICMMLARAEQEAIATQSALKQAVGELNPLGFQIEQFMVEDQHHLDELWQLLPQDVQRSPVLDVGSEPGMESPMGDPAVETPPVEEPPAEEPVAPPVPKEPPADVKEAFARALAKVAGTVIPFPGRGARMARGLKGSISDAVGAAGDYVGNLSPDAKAVAGMGGLGALVGGLNQAASVHGMPDEVKEVHREGSGPLTRVALDHPTAYGAAMGGLTLGGGTAAGLLAAKKNPKLLLPGVIAGSFGPAVTALAADRLLKEKSAAFCRGLEKLALGMPEPGFGTDPSAAPTPDTQPQIVPTPSMAQPGVQPPMANPPGQRQYAPMNYLEAEETARRAQAANEAEFYRGQAQQATGQVQSMGTQIADIQAQLEQLQAQAAESNAQIMTANQEAVQANDQMLNQATLAARMRMGMQQLRAQMMEVASQDPEQLAAAAGGPTPMDVGNQAAMAEAGPAGMPPGGPQVDPSMDPAMAQAGTPEASADPSTGPAQTPASSGGPADSGSSNEAKSESGSSDKKDGGETTVSIKKGSAKTADVYSETMGKIPYALGGAALGAGAGYLTARKGSVIPSLRQKVDELKGQQDGGFGKSIELAKAQLMLGEAEQSRANPMKSAIQGGLTGASTALSLAAAVPAGISEGKKLLSNLAYLRQG